MTHTPDIHIQENLRLSEIPQSALYEPYGYKRNPDIEGKILGHMAVTPDIDTPETWKAISDYATANGAGAKRLPILVMGGRTNLFPTEEGFEGLMVSYWQDDAELPNLVLDEETGLVECAASLPLAHFVQTMSLQYGRKVGNLTGIPGTVGAAVLGNSGRTVTRDSIGDLVHKVRTFDLHKGEEAVFYPSLECYSESFFGQRTSFLRRINAVDTRFVINSVVFSVGDQSSVLYDPQGAEELFWKRYTEREGPEGKNQEGWGTAGSTYVNGNALTDGGGKQRLVRYLMQHASLPDGQPLRDLDINGARFTGSHFFLKIDPERTRDCDVAEFFSKTLAGLAHSYDGFRPDLEINLLGRHGMLTLEEFGRHNDIDLGAVALSSA